MQHYGVFQRGETIVLRYGVEEGLDDVVGKPNAVLKRVRGAGAPGPNEPSLGNLFVNQVGADEDGPEGWLITVPATLTQTLRPGTYGTDLRMVLGGGIHISDTVIFRMTEAVTQ